MGICITVEMDNEKMIQEGYAWEYDGGTKKKDFEELREIRRSFGTLDEG